VLNRKTPKSHRSADYVRRLDAAITMDQARSWQMGEIKDWAWESHQIAVACVYKLADGKTELPREGPANLDGAYVSKNKVIVAKQLQKAGIRLATVLNKAFEQRKSK
jgi:hypothetical protein